MATSPTPGLINLDNSAPAAQTGQQLVEWQASAPFSDTVDYQGEEITVLARNVSGQVRNLGGVDARSTTTESIGLASQGKMVTLTNASPIAVTLETVPSTFMCFVTVEGGGAATLTPYSGTIDGEASLTLTSLQGVAIYFDGTNWETDRGAAAAGFTNPMTTEGDIIYGGASGTPERLAAGTSGYVLQTNGSGSPPTWVPGSGVVGTGLFAGVIEVPTIAAAGLTTALNQTGTFAQANNPVGFTIEDLTGKGSDFIEGIVKAYPSSPFTYIWLQSIQPSAGSFSEQGLVVANSLTSKVLAFVLHWGSGGPWAPYVLSYLTPNSSPSVITSTSNVAGPFIWFKYQDDGTNIYWSSSTDTVTWTQIYTVSRSSSYLGSSGFNYLGFGLEAYATPGTALTIMSLTETMP